MSKLLQTAAEKERASLTPMSQSILDTATQSFLSHWISHQAMYKETGSRPKTEELPFSLPSMFLLRLQINTGRTGPSLSRTPWPQAGTSNSSKIPSQDSFYKLVRHVLWIPSDWLHAPFYGRIQEDRAFTGLLCAFPKITGFTLKAAFGRQS